MPSLTGESQTSEEYAPHLYYKGKHVGAEEAKRLRECDEKIKKENIEALLSTTGVAPSRLDYENKGYNFEEECGSWRIQKQRIEIGMLHREGYVEVKYEPEYYVHRPAHIRQLELARQLCVDLREVGCSSLIEIPPHLS